MKICFFGTSHLGALQAGYLRIQDNFPNIQIDFYGVDGPSLVTNFYGGGVRSINDCLIIEKDLRVFFSKAAFSDSNSKNKTWGNMGSSLGTCIDLSEYDAVVLIDMYYRYIRIPGFTEDEQGRASLNGVPVSEGVIMQLAINGFGGLRLNNHPKYANVPFQRSIDLISLFKTKVNTLFLFPGPRFPLKNIVYQGHTRDYECSYKRIRTSYLNQLSSIGGVLLEQDALTLANSFATKDCYSRGVHPNNEKILDPHMNVAFGEIQIKRILNDVMENLAN